MGLNTVKSGVVLLLFGYDIVTFIWTCTHPAEVALVEVFSLEDPMPNLLRVPIRSWNASRCWIVRFRLSKTRFDDS